MRIGEVAERSGLAASAIRYYESLGILPQPVRGSSGYRGYDADDLDLLRFVSRLRSLEFPLSDVREIVALRRDDQAPCAAVRLTISREIAAIEDRVDDLVRLKTELNRLEEQAADLPDDWPTVCVCSVVTTSASPDA